MTMGWVSLLCGLIWGWISDHIGRKGALIIVYLSRASPSVCSRSGRRPPDSPSRRFCSG